MGYRCLVLPCDHCGSNYCPCKVGEIAIAIAQTKVDRRHDRAVAAAQLTDSRNEVIAARKMAEVA